MTVIFEPPVGDSIPDPDLESLRNLFLAPPEGYWLTGSGTGLLTWRGDIEAHLIIGTNEDCGFYLQYNRADEEIWLSLEDAAQLGTVAEAADEWYASVGLFVPADKAWLAIEDFCRTGRPSSRIEWIDPDELPEEGNW